ncbi:helix-turn-helix domain-containing protein [Bradyrhizobium betae]|uniref:helix-turn-helix domain-containing protein n=1 Tax=Bradyrhizobium betae TaxID=244734 RepID=UPI003D66A41D
MIATDHQYRTTRDRLERFTQTLAKLKSGSEHDLLHQARVNAILAQTERLKAELNEYDDLRSGNVTQIDASSLLDLPVALIKARIARGLSQSALAELVGVAPQQIQRWESGAYRKVAFETLSQIATALNVTVSERIDLSRAAPVPLKGIRRSLQKLGFPSEVVDSRIFPSSAVGEDISLYDELDGRIGLLLGIGVRDLAAGRASLQTSQLRFKLPASASQTRTRAYSQYVEALCRIVAKTSVTSPSALPISWQEMSILLFPSRQASLESALRAAWSAGIAVVPLADAIAFHGACWREKSRTVVVLKQSSKEESRWLLDLIHELYHAASEPLDKEFAILEEEETSDARRKSIDERRAQRFATEVITGGRTQELTDRIAQLAANQGPRLKSATQAVAKESGVPVGVLANILAHRLAESGVNWWAVAANLQSSSGEPWKIVRRIFFERADLSRLSRLERAFLLQALETS